MLPENRFPEIHRNLTFVRQPGPRRVVCVCVFVGRAVSMLLGCLLLLLTTRFCAARSLVIWDNRLPHYTMARLATDDTREVLFTTYLPVRRREVLSISFV